MDNRERFKAIMSFKNVDRYLNNELALWEQTSKRWVCEGLSNKIDCDLLTNGNKYLDLDVHKVLDLKILEPYPFREIEILNEDNRYCVFIDELGSKRKALKFNNSLSEWRTMDQYLGFPVKDRDSFNVWKKGFENHYSERYPSNWEEEKERFKKRNCPLLAPGVMKFGFYSMLRTWFGTEELSYIFYDNPILVEEMLDFLTEYIINVLDKALKEVEIDWFLYWEDMAYKTGPLISPKMVKKYFVPRYRKINEYLMGNGISMIFLDSDGNINDLIPLFIESGINGIIPIEVNASMDIVSLRKEYKDLLLIGGIDKLALVKGKEAIENEIYNKVDPIIDKGGFIPTIDHAIPPDVPLENFLYYLKLKRKILGY